jgi:phosphate butyryltransferase
MAMIKDFNELMERAKNLKEKMVISVAVAEDAHVLEAVDNANKAGICDAILVGDEDKIKEVANSKNIDLGKYEIIDSKDHSKAAAKAVQLVKDKKAHLLMKGKLHTSVLLKAVLNKEAGMRTGRFLSLVPFFEVPNYNRIFCITDVGILINPDLNQKKDIIVNAVEVTHSLGLETPKVAVVGALELVNPDMPATMEAAMLAKMNDRGQIKGAIVDGPFGMDNAMSEEAAKIKGIDSPVAGKADIVVVPDIEAGNIAYKSLVFVAGAEIASVVAGAKVPIILTSRADSEKSKMYSIALGVVYADYLWR